MLFQDSMCVILQYAGINILGKLKSCMFFGVNSVTIIVYYCVDSLTAWQFVYDGYAICDDLQNDFVFDRSVAS